MAEKRGLLHGPASPFVAGFAFVVGAILVRWLLTDRPAADFLVFALTGGVVFAVLTAMGRRRRG